MEQPTKISWSIPQRQSPAAIFIMLLKTAIGIIKAFWPIILIYFFRSKSDSEINYAWILIAFGVVTIVGSVLRYWFSKFHISDDNLIINTGWIKKKSVTLPLKNIQAVHLQQNLWQQFLKVSKVSIDSSGSEQVEVDIDALPVEKAEKLKDFLLEHSVHKVVKEDSDVVEAKPVIKLSAGDLMKLSLSANHLEAFFILLALGINLVDDIQKVFNIDGWKIMGDYAGRLEEQKIMAITILIVLIALISTFISIVRTSLKYFDFKLDRTTQGWKVNFGLINRQQLLIPFNKIQMISWRANFIRKKLDYWILHVQSIGHDDTKRKQHIKIPVVRLEQVKLLSHEYQATEVFSPCDGNSIASEYWKRKVFLMALPVTAFLFTLIYFITGNLVWWSLLLLPLISLYQYIWHKNFRYIANEEGVQMFSGVWGRRYTLLAWKKIQQVQLIESLYQQRKNLATVKFITAGGSVELPFVDSKTAVSITDYLLFVIESKNEKWL